MTDQRSDDAQEGIPGPNGVATPDGPMAGHEEMSRVRIRRAPRYSAFIALGALVGALAALIASLLSPPAEDLNLGQVFGYLLLFGLPLGAMLGALVALLFDGLSRRRERTATAGKLSVRVRDAGQETTERAEQSSEHSE